MFSHSPFIYLRNIDLGASYTPGDYGTVLSGMYCCSPVVDTASKQINTSIALKQHAWLWSAAIPEDVYNRIDDLPFDGFSQFNSKWFSITYKKCWKQYVHTTTRDPITLQERLGVSLTHTNLIDYRWIVDAPGPNLQLSPWVWPLVHLPVLPSTQQENQIAFDSSVHIYPVPPSTICLATFQATWRRITSDSWALIIISKGYAIEFDTILHTSSFLYTAPSPRTSRWDLLPPQERSYRKITSLRFYPIFLFLLLHSPQEGWK